MANGKWPRPTAGQRSLERRHPVEPQWSATRLLVCLSANFVHADWRAVPKIHLPMGLCASFCSFWSLTWPQRWTHPPSVPAERRTVATPFTGPPGFVSSLLDSIIGKWPDPVKSAPWNPQLVVVNPGQQEFGRPFGGSPWGLVVRSTRSLGLGTEEPDPDAGGKDGEINVLHRQGQVVNCEL